MNRSPGRWWCVVIAGAAIFASGCRKTTLELTGHGGFAYVRNDDGSVEVGFMKSVDNKVTMCKVPQFGVDLTIDDGTIVNAKDSNTKFDVSNAVITFDDMGSGAVQLTGNGLSSTTSGTPPLQPNPRKTEDDWKDIYWVPHTRLNYLNKRLHPNWRKEKVDGRMVLAGGSLSSGFPSDGASVHSIWEFKRDSDSTSFKQAITDRTRYRAEIRKSTIRITLDYGSRVEKLEVKPIDDRHTVGLTLTGRHDPDLAIPVEIKPGATINDFCAFYELLENVPPKAEQLMPHFVGKVQQPGVVYSGPQPSPGAYCPGDWP